jgi:hypothetical protein
VRDTGGGRTGPRLRAEAFLARHPDFRFAEELNYTIVHEWLEQESWEP